MIAHRNAECLFSRDCSGAKVVKSGLFLLTKALLFTNLIFLCVILSTQVNAAGAENRTAEGETLLAGAHGPRLRSDRVTPIKSARSSPGKFQKVSKHGTLLRDSAAVWSCVYDHSTKLTWEVKTEDLTLHDKNFEFRWGGGSSNPLALGKYLGSNQRETNNKEIPPTLSFNDWNPLVDLSVRNELCGLDDWRIPDLHELSTIVKCRDGASYDLDIGCGSVAVDVPAIDLEYFPNSYAESYWTTSLVGLHPGFNHAWAIHFSNGSDLPKYRGTYLLVRLVSGPK